MLALERLLDVSRKASGVLEQRGFEQPRHDAELLLAGVLGLKRLDLYLQHDRPLTEDELERYRVAIRRRLKREPVQYILGTAAFRNLVLEVDRRVLIPRPETEQLVSVVLEWAARTGRGGAVLDIGTGSGAIALSIASEGGFERIVATDVSEGALDVARANAVRLGLADRIAFRQGSLFDVVAAGERFDVIVSNPPYIGEAERPTLAPDVVEYEPAGALFAGQDGLSVIEQIIAGAASRLSPGGLLAMEIGAGQAREVIEQVNATGAYRDARITPDLAGRDRILTAVRP